MNDRDRRTALAAATRLHNWFQRSRLEPADFVRQNRATLDSVLAPLQPPPQRLPASKSWRKWSDPPAKEQASMLDFLARRQQTDWVQVELELARRHIQSDTHPDVPHYRTRIISSLIQVHAGLKVYRNGYKLTFNPKRLLKDGTPAIRLHKLRLDAARYIDLGYGSQPPLRSTFLPNLHPDDVELETLAEEAYPHGSVLHATLDRCFRKFAPLLPGYQPLALSLSLSDPLTGCQVYYIADLELHRGGNPPTLRHIFVGRAWHLKAQKHCTTLPYKTAKGALQAALKLYGVGAAAHIHPEEPK